MAESISLPGIGAVKRQWVYAGGALVAGVVGWAWWQRSRGAGPPTTEQVTDPGAVTDSPGVPGKTGDANVDVDHTGDAIDTNGEWTQAATEYLAGIGFEPGMVAVALGKYLSRTPLSGTEMDAVRAAVAAYGPPPVGGPYPIAPTLPTPPGRPNPPSKPRVDLWPRPLPEPRPLSGRATRPPITT